MKIFELSKFILRNQEGTYLNDFWLGGIKNALAMRYSSETKKFFNEEINEQNLPNFVWEILRLYPLVGGFPFYTSKNMEQRKVCIIGESSF